MLNFLKSSMKNVIITQSNYIPWKGYFDSMNCVDEFVIYDDMQYTKRDWRNRNKIKTQNGLIWLTIPVEVKGKFFQKIKDTKISEKSWNISHWNSIVAAYSKSKYFNHYKPFFEDLYLNCDSLYLSEVNFLFINSICELLKIRTNFKWSSEFVLAEEKTERLINVCKELGATDYYSGPAAKNYMNEELFLKEKINIHYFDYSNYPMYNQLYGDFTHEVSVIDLIFNEGPNSYKFLKYSKYI